MMLAIAKLPFSESSPRRQITAGGLSQIFPACIAGIIVTAFASNLRPVYVRMAPGNGAKQPLSEA